MITRYFLKCDVCGLETYNDGSKYADEDEEEYFSCLCSDGILKPTGKVTTIIKADERL